MPTKEAIETGMPDRIRHLPRNKAGYPVLWFVWTPEDGEPDFRVIAPGRREQAVTEQRCWVCGDFLYNRRATFVIGPMCCVNRVSAEPPSHLDCAVYSASHCPFLIKPAMHRRTNNLPADGVADGHMIERNPGVTLLWTSRTWRPRLIRNPDGSQGLLFDIGEPEAVRWFAQGRDATRAEVQEAIDSGLPTLRAIAKEEGPRAEQALLEMTFTAVSVLPA